MSKRKCYTYNLIREMTRQWWKGFGAFDSSETSFVIPVYPRRRLNTHDNYATGLNNFEVNRTTDDTVGRYWIAVVSEYLV